MTPIGLFHVSNGHLDGTTFPETCPKWLLSIPVAYEGQVQWGTSCHLNRMVEGFKTLWTYHNLQRIDSLRRTSQMIHRNDSSTVNTESWKWPNLARVPKPLNFYPPMTIPKLLLQRPTFLSTKPVSSSIPMREHFLAH